MTRALLVPVALGAVLCLAVPAEASDFRPVTTQEEFVRLVDGRALTRLGIRLDVSPDGEITGRAFGTEVSGDWDWRGQHFCRTLVYGSNDLGPNCQTVLVSGNTVRFIADEGRGDYADLRLR